MQISWLGYSAFRITSGGITVIVNPYDPESGFKINRQSADIVVSSIDHPEVAKSVSSAGLVIVKPGEYEVRSVFVYGISYSAVTLYLLTIDAMSIACIGPVKVKELSDEQLEVVEGADILTVPVGGGPVCSAKEAVQIINQVEPRIVIPSHYKTKGTRGLDGIDKFLKEYSASHEEVDKLKLHKKDLPQEDTRVVVIKRL